MLLFLSQLALLGLLTGLVFTDERKHFGLRFGTQVGDHVLIKLDMHPLQEEFSVCSWIKRIPHSDPYPYWFTYASPSINYEIMIRDDGVYWIFNQRSDFMSSVTSPDNEWRHHCVTWSSSSSQFQVFYEGKLIGTDNTPTGRKLGLSGNIALGNIVQTNGQITATTSNFGGEMFKLNVYNKALEESEVKLMKGNGLCSHYEDQFGLKRYIRWEDLLQEERSGNVTLVDMGCEAEGRAAVWDVLYSKEFYNKILTSQLLHTLTSTWDQLEHFVGSKISEGFIKHFKYEHGNSDKCDED